MRVARRLWQTLAPYNLRKLVSDWRSGRDSESVGAARDTALEHKLELLRLEIEQLHADHRRVAEMMDLVEQIALRIQVDLERLEQCEPQLDNQS